MIGAAASHEVRRRFSHEHILRAASLIFGAACLIVAARPGFAISFVVLAVGGAFWVQALSGFSVAAQLFSPRHAVGRVTATSTTVVFGGMAIGQLGLGPCRAGRRPAGGDRGFGRGDGPGRGARAGPADAGAGGRQRLGQACAQWPQPRP